MNLILNKFLILLILSTASVYGSYVEMRSFVLEASYVHPEDMNDSDFDQFCDDAKDMPGNGYRDSKDAAKEAKDF